VFKWLYFGSLFIFLGGGRFEEGGWFWGVWYLYYVERRGYLGWSVWVLFGWVYWVGGRGVNDRLKNGKKRERKKREGGKGWWVGGLI
jgi:hypothetical protein